jgi:hypothetical protein
MIGRHLIQQDEAGRIHGFRDPPEPVQVAAEGGQVLGQVLGIAHVGQHLGEPAQPRAGGVRGGRQEGEEESRLGHQAEQAQGLQTGRLAACGRMIPFLNSGGTASLVGKVDGLLPPVGASLVESPGGLGQIWTRNAGISRTPGFQRFQGDTR